VANDDGRPREPIPAHTPIPLNVDKRIDEIAMDLAACRADLDAEGKLYLARFLAFRTRHYTPPARKK